jgi:hypothetical protein
VNVSAIAGPEKSPIAQASARAKSFTFMDGSLQTPPMICEALAASSINHWYVKSSTIILRTQAAGSSRRPLSPGLRRIFGEITARRIGARKASRPPPCAHSAQGLDLRRVHDGNRGQEYARVPSCLFAAFVAQSNGLHIKGRAKRSDFANYIRPPALNSDSPTRLGAGFEL